MNTTTLGIFLEKSFKLIERLGIEHEKLETEAGEIGVTTFTFFC